MLVQWTSKQGPFHISKNIFWVQVHFKLEVIGTDSSLIQINQWKFEENRLKNKLHFFY